MAAPKTRRPMGGGSITEDLLGKAAAPPMGGDPEEDEFSADAEQKEAFAEMCAAIRDGDDDRAWELFQELRELGG